MTADLKAELEAGASGKRAETLEFSAVFRALMLPDLIGDIARISPGEDSPDKLQQGAFIEIDVDTLELVPLPTFAAFIKQLIVSSAGDEDDDPRSRRRSGFRQAAAVAKALTADQRALTFYSRMNGDEEGGSRLLERLYSGESNDLFNALCMSNDDHTLAVMEFGGSRILFAVLEEKFLKRNLGVFAVGRRSRVFGRIARVSDDLVGVQAISISLI